MNKLLLGLACACLTCCGGGGGSGSDGGDQDTSNAPFLGGHYSGYMYAILNTCPFNAPLTMLEWDANQEGRNITLTANPSGEEYKGALLNDTAFAVQNYSSSKDCEAINTEITVLNITDKTADVNMKFYGRCGSANCEIDETGQLNRTAN